MRGGALAALHQAADMAEADRRAALADKLEVKEELRRRREALYSQYATLNEAPVLRAEALQQAEAQRLGVTKSLDSLLGVEISWESVDLEIVKLVASLLKHFRGYLVSSGVHEGKIGGIIDSETITTAHAYILIHYILHKLRKESTPERQYKGKYDDFRKAHVKGMTDALGMLEPLKNQLTRKRQQVVEEGGKSVATGVQVAAMLVFQGLTNPAGLGAVSAGVCASGFVVATAGLALIPIITAMVLAYRSTASDWDGDVLSAYHLRNSTKDAIVKDCKVFGLKVVVDLGYLYKIESGLFVDDGARESLGALGDIVIDGFIRMWEHGPNTAELSPETNDLREGMMEKYIQQDKAEKILQAMVYINFFVTYYFKSRSTEVVKKVQQLQKRVNELESKMESLYHGPATTPLRDPPPIPQRTL